MFNFSQSLRKGRPVRQDILKKFLAIPLPSAVAGHKAPQSEPSLARSTCDNKHHVIVSQHYATGTHPVIRAYLTAAPNNARARYTDLATFAAHAKQESLDAAVDYFLDDKARAHLDLWAWLELQKQQGLSPATVSRRLCSLRQLTIQARKMGRISWELDLKLPQPQAVKDTRGPGMAVVRRMLEMAKARGPRSYAILRLFCDLALRRNEVANLQLEHINLKAGEIWIHGKGRTARERLSLPTPTREALAAWIQARGDWSGPLWPGARAEPMSAHNLYKEVVKVGALVGVKVRPHGLRHTAITHALDVTGGDVRKVRQFSRHKSLNMLLTYDDQRNDAAGQIASLLAEGKRKVSTKDVLRKVREELELATTNPEHTKSAIRAALDMIEQGGVS